MDERSRRTRAGHGVLIPLISGQLLGRSCITTTRRATCLNPFDIRATAWTELDEQIKLATDVLIPLISGQLLGHTVGEPTRPGVVLIPLISGQLLGPALLGKVTRTQGLNPFDIRATAWTHLLPTKLTRQQRLNPFDIRATAWTVLRILNLATVQVLIPLISGQLLGPCNRSTCRRSRGLNPFDIRATAWTYLPRASAPERPS